MKVNYLDVNSVNRQERAGPLPRRRRLVPRQADRRARGARGARRPHVPRGARRPQNGDPRCRRAQAEDTGARRHRWSTVAG